MLRSPFGLFLACALSLPAQHLRLGVIGGTALTEDYPRRFAPETPFTLPDGTIVIFPSTLTESGKRSFSGGPTLEWMLTQRLSLELDAIYRRLHLKGTGPTVTWQFPILAKYRLPLGPVTPFLEAGPSFRTTGNRNTEPSHTGFAAGAGFEIAHHGFQIAPTLRYTRWARDKPGTTQSRQDQLELFLAVSRAAATDRHPFGPRISLGVITGTHTPPSSAQYPLYLPARPVALLRVPAHVSPRLPHRPAS